MKLTKNLEAEIKQFMEAFWGSYLRGDLETWSQFVREDYRNIGTTEAEIWNSKEEILRYSEAVIHQMVGTVEMRNKQTQIIPLEPYFMVHEFLDVYIDTGEEWAFYSKMRLSSLIQKTDAGWWVIHQHGSLPDSIAQEGESIGFQKISKENRELREAVKRRTVELEHKNRELEIESSLERVRIVAMSMRTPDDLLTIAEALFNQLRGLGFDGLRNAMIHAFFDDEKQLLDYDFSDFSGGRVTRIPYLGNPVIERFIRDIRKAVDSFTEVVVTGDQLDGWKSFRKANGELDDPRLDSIASLHYYHYSIGTAAIGISTFQPVSGEQREVLKRFRNAFDFAYQRYTDVAQAEAQAREARIEVALERVRSRTMAMHQSNEILATANILYEELKKLGFQYGGIIIIIIDELTGNMEHWFSGFEHKNYPQSYRVPYFNHPFYEAQLAGWRNGDVFKVIDLSGELKKSYDQHMFSHSDYKYFPEQEKAWMMAAERVLFSFAYMKHGALMWGPTPISDNEASILKRFAMVFEQTYTRFLDLQKAEAQAREAKIEAALERTRAQSMIMQHSKELDETLQVFHEQILLLGIHSEFSFLWLPDEEKDRHIFWAVWEESKKSSTVFSSKAINYPLDRNEPATAQCLVDWKSNEAFVSYQVPPSGVESYFAAWQELFDGVDKLKPQYFTAGLFYVEAYIKYGCFGVMVQQDLTEDEKKILGRFATEFERTYTRFLELQKAEAQAREAQIQLALERVRARTMAMHNSEDVGKCIVQMFSEVTALGVDEGTRFGIGILNQDNENNQLWTASKHGEEVKMHIGNLDMTLHPLLKSARKAWKEQIPLHRYVLEGEDLLNYYQMLNNAPDYKYRIAIEKLPEREFHYGFVFDHGFFYAFTPHEFQPDLIYIVQRFTSLFEQTYRRYLDLVKAEAQAREAQIEVALERVRSRTNAMQHSDELAEASFILDSQVRALGIKTRGCAFNIYGDNESTEWFSSEAGTMPTYKTPREEIFLRYFEAGQRGESMYIKEFTGKACTVHYDYLCTLPVMGEALKKIKESGVSFPQQQIDHVTYFKYGYLLFITLEPVPEAHDIFKRFASVFEQTYTRFLDLQLKEIQARNLAIEKLRLEKTLTELRATQTQLIQKEKLASLGELTAGIAHEIQNPLNFVNNFAEVSAELVGELREEAARAEQDSALMEELLGDLAQNLEKITHHGSRASRIVKGMLDHSRASTGERHPTDLNVLTNEYLHLSYQGWVANHPRFACEVITQFDPELGTVDVVPPEIGRVLLNLFNNAYYAVARQAEEAGTGYQPTVWVSTKREPQAVEIRVRDNGTGISEAVFGKIFQPFFTTKPTGEGTGLGLSLSYDMVTKGHGGSLTVSSAEGEFTEFLINLPLNS